MKTEKKPSWAPPKGASRKLPEEGRHAFRLRGIIDLGTITDAKFKNKKHEIKALFELVDTNEDFGRDKGLEPHQLSKKFTFSLNEKSNMRKFWDSWRGKKYTDETIKTFNVFSWVGYGGECVVEHIKTADGSTIAVVNNAIPVPVKDQDTIAKLRNEPIMFRIDDPATHSCWDLVKVNKYDVERIAQCDEKKLIMHLLKDTKEEMEEDGPESQNEEEDDAPY